jgi:phosphoglycerate dehydrogenase-like enzyme
MSFTIWCNLELGGPGRRRLAAGLAAHRLAMSDAVNSSIRETDRIDPALAEADIVFGQPPVEGCRRSGRLRWIELSSAGYMRYDREDFWTELRQRGGALTNASSVFAEPCAQHALAMMLALGRDLLPSYQTQLTDHAWHYDERRAHSRLLTGQTVLLLGYGAIGRRLTELLAPFRMTVLAVRRQTRSEREVRIIAPDQLSSAFADADHIVNILPESDATRGFVNARRLSCCKPGARFYNIGRGATVDQAALLEALQSGRLAGAYLDVMEPEPLPPDHRLWSAPNCFITPHTAGGRHDLDDALVGHFLGNLASFERGEPLMDRVA